MTQSNWPSMPQGNSNWGVRPTQQQWPAQWSAPSHWAPPSQPYPSRTAQQSQPNAWQPQPQYQVSPYQTQYRQTVPPQQQYPAGWTPYQGTRYVPPTRKKKSPVFAVLGAAIFVFVLAGFAISMLNFLSSRITTTVNDPYTYQTDEPYQTEDPYPYETEDPYQSTTEPEPEPDPTQSQSTGQDQSGEVPAPDRDPSSLPEPTTYTEATEMMKENPVYAASVTTTNCKVDEIDITEASKSELEEHLNELTACLWLVWNPPLVASGFELPRPPVTVYGSSVSTACGRIEDTNAVYCSADQRIYYAKNIYEVIPKALRAAPFVADTVIAHEFGHAIQARTGILVSVHAWEEKSSTSTDKAEDYSRRTEMQADCWAGMFTSSVATANDLDPNELDDLSKVIYNLGDDVLAGYVGDHGSGEARQRWFQSGQGSTQVGTCNTFSAKSSEVK